MKMENRKALESLSLFTHVGGLVTIFIGVLVIMMDVLNSDFGHIQVGIFIFVVGYAFIKISSQLANIISSERIE